MREVKIRQNQLLELSSQILKQGGSFCFKAYGFSMHPFIQDGDIITVQPVNVDSLKKGDVIFYCTKKGRLLAHRIIDQYTESGKTMMITRADALKSENEHIEVRHILGRVTSIRRGKKSIDINRGFYRLITIFWLILQPFKNVFLMLFKLLKRVGSLFLYRLQGLKLYRTLARKIMSKRVTYRIATQEDDSDLSRFYSYHKLFELGEPDQNPTTPLISKQDNVHILLAMKEGRIVGATVIKKFPKGKSLYQDWWLFGMLVRKRYQGTGIGEGLVLHALNKAVEYGANKINLIVFEKNKSAVNLYRKMGFQLISIQGLDEQLDKDSQRGRPKRIIMSKKISKYNDPLDS